MVAGAAAAPPLTGDVDDDFGKLSFADSTTPGGRPKLLGYPRAMNGLAKEVLTRSEAGYGAASGLALPLSALLSPTTPLVDVNGDRLTESIAWLYDAVQTLEERGNILGAHLGRVEGTLHGALCNIAAADIQRLESPSASAAGGTMADEATAAAMEAIVGRGSMPTSPGAGVSDIEQRIWRLEKDVRRVMGQQERKRIVEEKMLEMRIDSLKCELDGRPSPGDLEGLKVHLAERLQELDRKTREDVGLLGSLLHQEGAADRRRLLTQLEAFQHRLEASWEVAESKLKVQVDRWDEKLHELDGRLKELDSPTDGKLAELEARLLALEDLRGASLAPTSVRSPSAASLAARRIPADGSAADGSVAAGGSPLSPAAPFAPMPAGGLDSLDGVVERLQALEAHVMAALAPTFDGQAAQAPAGGAGDSPAFDGGATLPGKHSELARRVQRLETATFGGNMTFGMPGGAEDAPSAFEASFGTGADADPLALAAGGGGGGPLSLASTRRGRTAEDEVSRQLEDIFARLRALEGHDGGVVEADGEESGVAEVAYSDDGPAAADGIAAAAADGAVKGGADGTAVTEGARPAAGEAKVMSPSSKVSLPSSPKSASVARSPSESQWRRAIEERVSELEHALQDPHSPAAALSPAEGTPSNSNSNRRSANADVTKLRRSLDLLAKFVLGPNPTLGEEMSADVSLASTPRGSLASAAPAPSTSGGGDPLAWLERNRRSVIGNGLEARLRELEGAGGGGGGGGGGPHSPTVIRRVRTMEDKLSALDLEYSQTLKPELQEFRREQQDFQSDLHRQVSEIKVAVGCLEACVPRDTRKAIELFKRAAGKEDRQREITPLGLELEGKILLLQDDIEKRLQAAEVSMSSHVDRVGVVVRDLERKQEQFREQLASVNAHLGGSPPTVVARSTAAPPLAPTDRGDTAATKAPASSPGLGPAQPLGSGGSAGAGRKPSSRDGPLRSPPPGWAPQAKR